MCPLSSSVNVEWMNVVALQKADQRKKDQWGGGLDDTRHDGFTLNTSHTLASSNKKE